MERMEGRSWRRPRAPHPEPRVSWLLVLPLLALILVAPPALGSYSALRTGTALQQPFGYDTLPADGTLRLNLVDYAGRAAYDHGRSLGDRQVKVTGFVALDVPGRRIWSGWPSTAVPRTPSRSRSA